MANQTQVWLKTIGTAEERLPGRWLPHHVDLLAATQFVKQPTGIQAGDFLVYYATGWQRLFAVAKATEAGASTRLQGSPAEKHWPFMLHVQVLLAVPQLTLAPEYGVLEKPSSAVMKKSHLRLTDQEYQRFLAALPRRVSV